MTGQLGVGIAKGHIVRSAEHLDNRLILIALNDTAQLFLIAVHRNLYNLLVGRVLYAFQGNQGAVDFT